MAEAITAPKFGDLDTVTELTSSGFVTRKKTPADKRLDTLARRRRGQEQVDAAAAGVWYEGILRDAGLTLADLERLPGLPVIRALVKSRGWRTGDDGARYEWLLRQRILVDLELRARYWRIGKRLRAKILAACGVPA